MSCKTRILRGGARSAILLTLAGGSVAQAQPQTPSPVQVAPAGITYPNGEQGRSEYEFTNEALSVVPSAVPGQASNVARLAAAARAQGGLMQGLTLQRAETRQIGLSAVPPAVPPPGLAIASAVPLPSPDDKFISVHRLLYGEVPLAKNSDVVTIVRGDNQLLLTRKRNLPTSVDGTEATNTAQAAVTFARQSAGASFAGANVQASEPVRQVWVDEQSEGHLTWTFTLNNGSVQRPDVRRFWVAAIGEPRILQSESEVYYAQFGQVRANVWAEGSRPGAPIQTRTLSNVRVTRAMPAGSILTGPNGLFGFADGDAMTQFTTALQGPRVVLQSDEGPNLQVAQPGTSANSIDLNFGAGNVASLAQTSAFYWTNFAYGFAQSAIGAGALANVTIKTGIDDRCNAYWFNSTLNFFRAESDPNGCANTAYSDVVLHEFGHGVDEANGGIVDGGYSEGFGDALAILGTRQSCFGREFVKPGMCARDANEKKLWPPAVSEVHEVGRPYAGFVWELVRQLKQTYSEDESFQLATRLVLGAAAANPQSVPDAVLLSFVVDAPDGNPAHGSPHFKELAAAADVFKFPRPDAPLAAAGARASSASFPLTPPKQVSGDGIILQTSIHLDRPSAVHVIANSSALSTTVRSFQTGFYNAAMPADVLWRDSTRDVAVQANQWTNFGSTFAINLPAGDQIIYWKMHVPNGQLTLSSGTLLVQAFTAAGTGPDIVVADAEVTAVGSARAPSPAALAAPTVMTPVMVAPPAGRVGTDAYGQPITRASAR